MNEFLLVLGIATFAAFLTFLGAPLAERFDVPHRVISAALQFASGVIAALVALSLMPPAARAGAPVTVALAFFVGGVVFVLFDTYSAKRQAARATGEANVTSMGLYVGILVDLFIDGVVIGIGSTLTLATGLLLALGMAISTLPLAFVTTSTAKKQGVSPENRRRLAALYFACVLGGAVLGYAVLQDQSVELRLVLISLASGFLVTTVTQSLIPEANREGEPGFAGILFVAGMSIYALLTLVVK
jgi:ZIP family zinc transporter